MSREEFMDIVYTELYDDGDNYRANRIIDAADEYAEESKQSNEWISINERYPDKEGKDYLVCYDDGVITIETLFINYEELPFFSNMCVGVVAWMELPQPWKGE